MPIHLPVLGCLLALAGVIVSEHVHLRMGNALFKPLASLAFLLAALAAGALATSHGRTVFVGLSLCAVGDVVLLCRSRTALRVGMGLFLLGHLAYGTAFLRAGVSGPTTGVAALGILLPAVLVLVLLYPHVPRALRVPVVGYVAVISAMVALAWGHVAGAGPLQVGVGATLFWVSDVGVARDRFVRRSSLGRTLYLPLYYAAQLLLATSVAAAG
ncbi:MAG: lysoplasmalogenase [Deltaproteobacteria bacterium]|nr:lysoplasmalogenase [Deltaproteobacteria bacterium]